MNVPHSDALVFFGATGDTVGFLTFTPSSGPAI